MMILKHLTLQIIPLAIGLGIGYWLLVTANTQKDSLKTVGQVLGWILIAMSIFTSLFSNYYSIKMIKEGNMYFGHHGCRMMQDQDMQKMEDKGKYKEENESIQENKNEEMMNEKDKDEAEKQEKN